MLLISSIDDSSIIVFDTNTQKITAAISDIPESQDIDSLYLLKNDKFVLQINEGGHFYFYDIATQKRVLNGLYIDDEIVLYTDEGFYDATPEGARYVTWHYPGLKQHFDFSQFESQFKRPDIIKGILTGQKVQKPSVRPIPPPSLEMRLKHQGNYVQQATVELNVNSIQPLSNLRLFVDGAPVMEIPVTGKQAHKTMPLELKRGKHWITAVAYNDKGYSSIPQSLMVDASQVKALGGNLYVLGVGVDNYPNMPKANLDYAKQDIIAFAETARANPAQQYENIVIKQLLNEIASPTNIYQTLTNIVQQATIDDTLMLYFAGHGEKGKDGQFYFLTSQASFGDFETTGLAWEKVAALLAQTKAKVIVFLDACHSGVASQETVVPNDEYVTALMKTGKAGMVVMAASKGRQFSFEDIDFGDGHGAFNYAITQALTEERQTTDTNQNGIIELSELYRSVKFNVHKLTDGK
ncbi:caspase family protein, partial [Candidatus Marithioploca araucensis]|nr:caspase family protein [Candidatus Marithioploca araucensis]